MSAFHVIDDANVPALGDVRDAGPGDLVYVRPAATIRSDFSKYWEAAGVALARGAQVVVMNREEG
ncbi:hypothetical protein [Streptomyces silvensis]|uniref:Uncharacterized protein n=1 Tax=Streptomyces silvensis TaxID=1765722 RepID=A0A0W7X889_9ACTN|nr:hypothetical protein [Streptomyces silvensis]KUF18834.1 hypothetical protein AT728_07310 [Streptomyces silvensis]